MMNKTNGASNGKTEKEEKNGNRNYYDSNNNFNEKEKVGATTTLPPTMGNSSKKETKAAMEKMKKRMKNNSTKQEKNRPGRIVLITLIALVAIFLDFETSYLSPFQASNQAQQQQQISSYDATHTRNYNQSNQQVQTIFADQHVNQSLFNNENATTTTTSPRPAPTPTFSPLSPPPIQHININPTQQQQTNDNDFQSTFNQSSFDHDDEDTNNSNSSCFPFNSKQWLHGPRWSNINLPQLDIHSIIQRPTSINHWKQHLTKHLLSHSLCPKSSPLYQINSNQQLKYWTSRLLFMAIHEHHHAPARQESQVRQSCQQQQQQERPSFDDSSDLQQSPHDWEYECPRAKFLISNLPNIGLGASFRLGAVNAMLMGIATNRITIFVNHFNFSALDIDDDDERANHTKRLQFIQQPWSLTSCPTKTTTNNTNQTQTHDRQDFQCVFMPTTPCVLTLQDIVREGILLPEVDARDLRRQGILAQHYQDRRILLVESRLSSPKQWSIQTLIQKRLYHLATQLIDHLEQQQQQQQEEQDQDEQEAETDQDIQSLNVTLLRQAANIILNDTATIAYQKQLEDDDVATDSNNATTTVPPPYVYGNRYTQTAHVALMYLMRPNPYYQEQSNQILDDILDDHQSPSSNKNNNSTSLTIGLPIRGSDKCKSESICLTPDIYMDLVRNVQSEFYSKQGQSLSSFDNVSSVPTTNVVLTTEDGNIIQSLEKIQQQQEQEQQSMMGEQETDANITLFPDVKFIWNPHDVFQGSGAPRTFRRRANDILLSTLVALKLQFHHPSHYVFGNCCSNFHLVLFDFLYEGCGNTPNNNNQHQVLTCLQEHVNPKYHICCGWTRTRECNDIRDAQAAERKQREAANKK